MKSTAQIRFSTRMPSPIGELVLLGSDLGLSAVYMETHPWDDAGKRWETSPVLDDAREQLSAYFLGRRNDFSLPLDLHGTDFQKAVWTALRTIPYGETRSYGDIAREIKNPQAVRAVGLANGQNPISIIVPCHRVIGKNGTLTGYGGGLERKKYLLELECSRGF